MNIVHTFFIERARSAFVTGKDAFTILDLTGFVKIRGETDHLKIKLPLCCDGKS